MEKDIIRPIRPDDLPQIAQIHKEMFFDHFLGKYSLCTIQSYYREFIRDCVFLVSEEDEIINGFVLGGMSQDLNRAKAVFVKKYRLLYLFDTAIRPWVYMDALARIKTLFAIREQGNGKVSNDSIRLLSIAVSLDAQGSGVATKLVRSFEEAISPWKSYGLSVLSHNLRAQAFYQKNGFIIEREDGSSIYLRENNVLKPRNI